jgi:hypothetical protein
MAYDNPQLQKISELQMLLIKARGMARDLVDDDEITDMLTATLHKQIKTASKTLETIGDNLMNELELDAEFYPM